MNLNSILVASGFGLLLVACGGGASTDASQLRSSHANLSVQTCVDNFVGGNSGQAPSSADVSAFENCVKGAAQTPAQTTTPPKTTPPQQTPPVPPEVQAAVKTCVDTFLASFPAGTEPTQAELDALTACVEAAVPAVDGGTSTTIINVDAGTSTGNFPGFDAGIPTPPPFPAFDAGTWSRP